MKKTLITLTTVTVVGFGSVFLSTPASADSLEDLKQQQTEVQQDRESLKATLSTAEAEIAELLIEIEEINQEIDQTNDALEANKATMNENEENISTTEVEIENLEVEIAELEKSIQLRFDILKERAVSYQKNGGNISYIEVLFGSKNFTDFISRVTAVNKITQSDASLIDEIEKDKAEVEVKQAEVLVKLDELKEMRVELTGMQATIKEQQEQSVAQKEKLQTKENQLATQVDELKMEDNELASLQREIRTNIDILSQPAPVPVVQVASSSAAAPAQAASGSATVSEATESRSTTNSKASSNKSSAKSSVKKSTEAKETKSAAPTSRTAASGGVSTAINAGFAHLGTPYRIAGKGPGGFDCSGFVSWAFAQGGISIPSYTGALASTGTKVSASNMQPGDVVFFDTYKKNGHVGIYLGGGQFIGAQNSTGLAVADMTSGYWKSKFKGHVRSMR